MKEIATDVAVVSLQIVNAYLVGNAQSWVLVDSGLSGKADKIRKAAENRFGPGARPNAIVLTHGHFDHAGSAKPLAQMWNVPVYAHPLELPYLTGRSSYPPLDPTAPGFFSALSRLFPAQTADLQHLVSSVDMKNPLPGLHGWTCIDTPGHSPGHLSFYRESDGTLLAGDALTTLDLDTVSGVLTKKKKVSRPPVPATTNWPQAQDSVGILARLRPRIIAPGHGQPMANAQDELQALADNFPIPTHGRYVDEPARVDANGVTYLPPAPPDRTPRIAAGLAIGITIATTGILIARKQDQKSK